MVNTLYRWPFVLLGMAPLSIGLFAAGAENWVRFVCGIALGLFVCLLAGIVFRFWVKQVVKAQEKVVLKFSSIAKRRGGADSYFLAYVLPLFVGDHLASFQLMGLISLFAIVCFFSEVESNNPLAKILGYRFYDIETGEGNSVLVMSKKSIPEILRGRKNANRQMLVVMFDDSFAIQVV